MSVLTDRLMSRREVEHVTGRARTTLYRMAMSGELCPRKVRGRLGYLESEVPVRQKPLVRYGQGID